MQPQTPTKINTPPALLQTVIESISEIILGKEHQVRLALSCLLAKGHLLIEDLPGVGKTTLAHTLAKVCGLQYQRIQFTSDLLPTDILGVSIYQRETGHFEFRQGPIFSQLILADEINRATPKTQSALLEAMEERQVTTEGETRLLPQPFFVIATQNPNHQIGTFPLPESQLDRFLMRLSLGYLDHDAERTLLEGSERRELLESLQPVLSPSIIEELQTHISQIHVAAPLFDYIQKILQCSRESDTFANGLSPRAGLAIKHSAQAWAMLNGRNHVIPEDVQAILPAVTAHRLQNNAHVPLTHDDIVEHLIKAVAIP